MYGYPTRLPQISNREDLLITLSIFDDDTGQPLNLSGTVGSGTFSSWNVRAGNVVTTSTTTITIPPAPIGNQLSALALTVPSGLAISAGNPITITDLSGLNSMSGYVTSYNSQTGALVAQIGLTFQFEIRNMPPSLTGSGQDYVWWWDFGATATQAPLVSASLGNGITIIDVGFIQIRIPESQIKNLQMTDALDIGSYLVGLTTTDSFDTRQIFIASLPVLYGGVTN